MATTEQLAEKWAVELAHVHYARQREGWGQTEAHLKILARRIIVLALAEAKEDDSVERLAR